MEDADGAEEAEGAGAAAGACVVAEVHAEDAAAAAMKSLRENCIGNRVVRAADYPTGAR